MKKMTKFEKLGLEKTTRHAKRCWIYYAISNTGTYYSDFARG